MSLIIGHVSLTNAYKKHKFDKKKGGAFFLQF